MHLQPAARVCGVGGYRILKAGVHMVPRALLVGRTA